MPPTDQHYESSRKRTGKEYREVHEWLDSNDPDKAAEHHDITRMHEHGRMIEEQYGSEALAEYIEHVREDVHSKLSRLAKDESEMAEALAFFGC